MKVATLKEAKIHLGKLVSRALRGETVIIVPQPGKPAVRLTAISEGQNSNKTNLKLSAEELRKLDAWADKERAAVHTRVFESPAAYVAHRRAQRGKSTPR